MCSSAILNGACVKRFFSGRRLNYWCEYYHCISVVKARQYYYYCLSKNTTPDDNNINLLLNREDLEIDF